MQPLVLRAPIRGSARLDALERQLERYRPPFQAVVRRLAAQESRIADLASSFPALLFALAAPRPGLDPACAIAHVINGAALADVAAAAGVPLWLRRLPPEAFTRRIARLPDGRVFRRQIANHLPRRKASPVWLQAVTEMADVAHEEAAIWIAREVMRKERSVKLDRLRLVGLWAWFSGHPGTLGYTMAQKRWTPEMQFDSALNAADEWRMSIDLYANLGRGPVADSWLRPARIDGYDFLPLASASEIVEEAATMKNCLRNYGRNLAFNCSRLWSVRKDAQRVATLKLATRYGDPLPNVVELRAAGNGNVSPEVSWAVWQWLHMHDLLRIDAKPKDWRTVPLDRPTWIAIWRPYWMAKRRIPQWLPLSPSRDVLAALS
jgi:hypothetical protein